MDGGSDIVLIALGASSSGYHSIDAHSQSWPRRWWDGLKLVLPYDCMRVVSSDEEGSIDE